MGEERIEFTLLSHTGELEFVDPKNTQGDYGHTYQDELLIRIKQGLPKDLAGSTLLHEVIHLIELLTHVKFEENEIDCLALGLYSFLKENPHLREILFGEEVLQEERESEDRYDIADSEFCSWAPECSPRTAAYSGVMGVEPTIPRPSYRGDRRAYDEV